MGLFVVLVLVVFLAPLLVFVPRLVALRRQSLLAYGALVGRLGRLVDHRWIRGEVVDDRGLLDAPELGPVADTLTLYEAVGRLRSAPSTPVEIPREPWQSWSKRIGADPLTAKSWPL